VRYAHRSMIRAEGRLGIPFSHRRVR
jgi:hypothetical protein